ncbi:MAG: patatin-like phospholipase family protein [Arenicella sp.]
MTDKISKEIQIRQREGLALSLSGGGYRATLFHLGLLRRLNELDLLKSVDAISSVSGGSITAAKLAKTSKIWKRGRLGNKYWNTVVRDPLVEFAALNIRTGPILSSMAKFWQKGVAVQKTEERYYQDLTDQTLGDLPDDVDFVFCASDMVFSTHWYFRKKTSKAKATGNHRAGRLKNWESIPVAKAVAASSCFPPVFGPMVLAKTEEDFYKPSTKRDDDWEELVKQIRLTDGGVYDNLGIEPVWRDYKNLIVSDGGKPTPFTPLGSAGQLSRLPGLFQEQIEDLRKRMLIQRSDSKCVDFNAALIMIGKGGAPKGYSKLFAKEVLSGIRTDLDSFSEVEARVLENHSYALADYYIKQYLLHGLDSSTYDTKALNDFAVPNPEYMDEDDLRCKLKRSGRRSLFYKWRVL